MVEVSTKLTGDVTAGLDKFEARIKQSILLSGVAAMGRVIYEEVKLNTSGARAGGPLDPPGVVTGTLHKNVYRAYIPEKSNDAQKVYHVSVRKGKKGAPHWALVEFGTSRMAARPYLRPAADKMDAAIKAGTERIKERLAE